MTHCLRAATQKQQVHPEIAVVGAGICGLTAAVRLAELGHPVRLHARELPPDTTSCAAGALFGPLHVEHPDLPKWCGESWEVFDHLADFAGTGVTRVSGFEASRSPVRPDYDWLPFVADLDELDPADPPARAGFRSGWRYSTFAVDTPTHCAYLVDRFRVAGGTIVQAEITELAALAAPGGIVVNCTAGDPGGPLADRSVRQLSGAVLVVDNPGIDYFFADADDAPELTYFIPHGDSLILGGTQTPGEPARPSASEIDGILARCARVEPRLEGVTVRAERVGARPVRTSVRLEAEIRQDRCVIHNYGHGGGGVSLAWGCAAQVVSMAEQHLSQQ